MHGTVHHSGSPGTPYRDFHHRGKRRRDL